MEKSNSILNELHEISSLIASIEKVNVFTVPDGYFDWITEDILAALKHDIKEEFDNSYDDIPQGYFDGLADSIMGRIRGGEHESSEEELRSLSPMLLSIQGKNVFRVPDGYFDEFGNEILSKLKPQQAKVISLKRTSTVFFRYAVAAVFTGVMALGVFRFTETKNRSNELPDYVKAGLQIKDVDHELSKLSDDAIMQYLEASGSDVKTALVVNSVDNNNLPSEEEYLFDEQALDKYLNSINIEETKN